MSTIRCPGCECEITPDGRTLKKRSPYLTDLESAVLELERAVVKIERQAAEVAKLRAAQKGDSGGVEKPKPVPAGKESGPGSENWLDRIRERIG